MPEMGTEKGYEGARPVTIKVERGGGAAKRCGLSVQDDPLELSIEKKDKGAWTVQGASAWTVEFDPNNSPFDVAKIDQNTPPVALRANVTQGTYKYKVTVPGFGHIDPDVIVNR